MFGTLSFPVLVRAMVLCLSDVSVCLSRVGVLSNGMNGLIWFLAWMLLATSPTLCFKKVQVSTKIMVLPSVTFS